MYFCAFSFFKTHFHESHDSLEVFMISLQPWKNKSSMSALQYALHDLKKKKKVQSFEIITQVLNYTYWLTYIHAYLYE